ncbi:DUF6255 family natural product biosynthesis protein [Streptomyces olivoverticillatus]|uniref:DUF6255 family natural product biosynthesis protein n=1 Tax=Streptomyces olivoverticillatus TaxID=66427 RepID=UPI001C885E25
MTATATAYAAGRLVGNCSHRGGWTHDAGELRCDGCGTRRFTDYGALRPPGLPSTVTSSARGSAAQTRGRRRPVVCTYFGS